MKNRLLTFINTLRDARLPITVAESLDALRAVGFISLERARLREALACALIKDEANRPAFDAAFDRFFGAPERHSTRSPRLRRHEDGAGHGSNTHESGTPSSTRRLHEPLTPARRQTEQRHVGQGEDRPSKGAGARLAHKRTLQAIPFREMSTTQIEGCEVLMAELAQRFQAHLNRRQRAARRGRIDIRRTVRRSISNGGVPIVPAFRERRPGQPDLVALCDNSHSVTVASRFLMSLLLPAQVFFRHTRIFAFVDRPVEVSIESGNLVPHEDFDFYARSDFGQVLLTLWERYQSVLTRNTVLLVLSDARNNRRPPRADILARIHSIVRKVVWLNPDTRDRWDTGDSVVRKYRPHCNALLAASTLRELFSALQRTLRAQ